MACPGRYQLGYSTVPVGYIDGTHHFALEQVGAVDARGVGGADHGAAVAGSGEANSVVASDLIPLLDVDGALLMHQSARFNGWFNTSNSKLNCKVEVVRLPFTVREP